MRRSLCFPWPVPSSCGLSTELLFDAASSLTWTCDENSERACFALALSLSVGTSYSVSHLFWAFIEKNRFWGHYKLDRQPHQLATKELVMWTMKEGMLTRLIIGPAGLYAIVFSAMKWRGMPSVNAACPPLLRLYLEFLFVHFMNDLSFYWAHRIFHSSKLYAKVHKQHHEWKGPASIASEYSTPVEQTFANLLPASIGCFLTCAHPWTVCVWMAERVRNTYEEHSGYASKIPLLNSLGVMNWREAAQHDFHHTHNSGNFGPEWFDWLFGTMDSYAAQGGAEGYVASKGNEKLSYMRQ